MVHVNADTWSSRLNCGRMSFCVHMLGTSLSTKLRAASFITLSVFFFQFSF